MYNNVVTSVRTSDGDTDDFPIKIGQHQGLALNPYLFDLVMDEVTRDIQGDIPWCMLFAYDVVLIDDSRTRVNRKLELKGKFYRTTNRTTMLYGVECWSAKRCHVQQLGVTEMRMLRWMCGHTRRDRVQNDDI
jgi:hypothetical protein